MFVYRRDVDSLNNRELENLTGETVRSLSIFCNNVDIFCRGAKGIHLSGRWRQALHENAAEPLPRETASEAEGWMPSVAGEVNRPHAGPRQWS